MGTNSFSQDETHFSRFRLKTNISSPSKAYGVCYLHATMPSHDSSRSIGRYLSVLNRLKGTMPFPIFFSVRIGMTSTPIIAIRAFPVVNNRFLVSCPILINPVIHFAPPKGSFI